MWLFGWSDGVKGGSVNPRIAAAVALGGLSCSDRGTVSFQDSQRDRGSQAHDVGPTGAGLPRGEQGGGAGAQLGLLVKMARRLETGRGKTRRAAAAVVKASTGVSSSSSR
jgi:hypothetical protein